MISGGTGSATSSARREVNAEEIESCGGERRSIITTGMISSSRQMFQVAVVSLKSTATGVCHFAQYERSTGIPGSGSY